MVNTAEQREEKRVAILITAAKRNSVVFAQTMSNKQQKIEAAEALIKKERNRMHLMCKAWRDVLDEQGPLDDGGNLSQWSENVWWRKL